MTFESLYAKMNRRGKLDAPKPTFRFVACGHPITGKRKRCTICKEIRNAKLKAR